MVEDEPQFLEVGTGAARRRIAYRVDLPRVGAASPGVDLLWLPGFKSDMASTKATALAEWAREARFGYVRFDYSGHGLSDGRFEDGTIGLWLEEARAVHARATREAFGALIVVGSSMGAYIALLMLRRLREEGACATPHVAGLVLIAPAWDMTEKLIWKAMSESERRHLMTHGVFPLPSPYGEPTPITRRLIQEGRDHLLSDRPFDPGCPVHVLQGLRDEDVPPSHARRLADVLHGSRVEFTEIADGDHRLSRPEDLRLLFRIIEGMVPA